MVQRRRERRYEALVGVRVPLAMKDRLEALADQERASLGIVIRRCLEAGIDQIERGGDAASRAMMADARDWWAGLNRTQRAVWQSRLPGLKGRDLIAEAWKAETWHQTQGR